LFRKELRGITGVIVPALLAAADFYMVQAESVLQIVPDMPTATHFEDQRGKRWCACVILLAVCSLTVSLATRYFSVSATSSNHEVRTIVNHSQDAKRQHLAKDAVNWIAPVACRTMLAAPAFYPRFAPAGPPAPSLLFEEILYNRPPPSSEFLS
jgi:hypothetical protein